MIETVEAGSRLLERELGLGDLVLTQVLSIVGLPWVGVAAKQGPAHVVCWLMAAVLFHLPSHCGIGPESTIDYSTGTSLRRA